MSCNGSAENGKVLFVAALHIIHRLRYGKNGVFSEVCYDVFGNGCGKIDFTGQFFTNFGKDVFAGYDGLTGKTKFLDVGAQAACGKCGDDDVRVQEDLHEMALNTSSSVSRPCDSAKGRTFFRNSWNCLTER